MDLIAACATSIRVSDRIGNPRTVSCNFIAHIKIHEMLR